MRQLWNLDNIHYENNMPFQLLVIYSGKGEDKFKLFTIIFFKCTDLNFSHFSPDFPFLHMDLNSPVRSLPSPSQIQTSSKLYRQVKVCGNSTSCKYLLCRTPVDEIGTATIFITYTYNMKERWKKEQK